MQTTVTILALVLWLSNHSPAVQSGLDNVSSFVNLFGARRIGIVTNHTAYDSQGRYIVDVIRSIPGATVTALFSPEHGLWGTERAGAGIDTQIHPLYRLPVYSLYGRTLKPTPEMLAKVDVLVFDMQDVGARFYTYIYTMSLAMEAAAEHGKRFIILDRPNPINGLRMEGNILEPQFASFVGLYPIPVRHGMTIAELAKMFNERGWLAGGVRADLVVIPMKGWRRRMWYDQTGLPFIRPSPNIPDLETAVLYPGMCFLEGTNVSEGRGTDMPFRQFGAPWIDSHNLAGQLNRLDLPGLRFGPATFTPTTSKYQDQKCNGVRIIATDRDRLEPYWSGIRIVNQIYRMYPDNFEWKAEHFDRLCGTAGIRQAIVDRSSLDELRDKWQADLKSFQRIRSKYLMYPD